MTTASEAELLVPVRTSLLDSPSGVSTLQYQFMGMVVDREFIQQWRKSRAVAEARAIARVVEKLHESIFGYDEDRTYEMAWHIHQKLVQAHKAFAR
jgi:hypothetical protein